MKKLSAMFQFRDVFMENSRFKTFLLSILITGISYGLYKGMLDNFLAEIVGMGEMDRGITEFFRELPGILLIFILAAFCMLSAETLYKAGAIIMLVGMGMHAVLPATKVLATLAICMYSLGEHIQIGMKNTLTLKYAKPGYGGAAIASVAGNAVATPAIIAGLDPAWAPYVENAVAAVSAAVVVSAILTPLFTHYVAKKFGCPKFDRENAKEETA